MIYNLSKKLTVFSLIIGSAGAFAQTTPTEKNIRIIEAKDIPLDTTAHIKVKKLHII